ncbi:MAG: FIST N-terminal domain-containing protein [Planctomycetota bacterium]
MTDHAHDSHFSPASAAPRCAVALSTHADTSAALAELVAQLGTPPAVAPSIAVLFFSRHHQQHIAQLLPELVSQLGTENLIACRGESILGGAQEIEQQPAIVLWTALLPGVEVIPLELDFEQTPEGGLITGWPDAALDDWPPGSAILLLGDPFTFPADLFLQRINEDRPQTPVIGGMCSGMQERGDSVLAIGRHIRRQGAVGLLLRGDAKMKTVVSQGCRPIGEPLVITKVEDHLILELGGRPALQRLNELYLQLPTHEQQLAKRGLHVGRAVSEYRERFNQGDFLIRNIMNVVPGLGGFSISDSPRVGQTVQFHLRDRDTATADLQLLLRQFRDETARRVVGGLVFSCNGRGSRLFAQPHHDANAIQNALGPLPLAGFFAAGEIGPVGGQNFMHGFTASIALFHD